MNKFEQLIEYVINDDEANAKALFHEIVVDKSKDIYEEIMAEEEVMEKQGYKDREDEHLGAKDGAESGKKQSMKDRRDDEMGKNLRIHGSGLKKGEERNDASCNKDRFDSINFEISSLLACSIPLFNLRDSNDSAVVAFSSRFMSRGVFAETITLPTNAVGANTRRAQ